MVTQCRKGTLFWPRALFERGQKSQKSKHLEIFALLPVRHLGLKTLDLGVLDVDVIVDKAGAERLAEKVVGLQRDHRFGQRPRQQFDLRFTRHLFGRGPWSTR